LGEQEQHEGAGEAHRFEPPKMSHSSWK